VTSPETAAAQWWSATATWRLLRCPASATRARAPVRPTAHHPDNAGTVAHLALQAWVENEDWSQPDPGTRLQQWFDQVAAAYGADPARMPQAVVTRARLKSRGSELAEILAAAGSGVRSELLLKDSEHHLFGILDVAAPGTGGLIIDLKSGQDASAEASPAIKHQMTFYAHLFHSAYGVLPEHVVVFSLQRGPAEIEVTSSSIAALLAGIRNAQTLDRTTAQPDADTCRFCPKRMSCEPQWEAIGSWDRPDALQGPVGRIEYSSSGATALLIDGQWLTGIPVKALPPGAAPGQFARAIRVRRRGGSMSREWTATSTTRIHLAPAP
jgi:hypothetical protein